MDRRQFLKTTGATALGATVAGLGLTGAAPASAATAQFVGHKPGKIYLGMSVGGQTFSSALDMTGPVGLHRTFYGWSSVEGEIRNIKDDHAANRLPWVSFKPPTSGGAGWKAIAAGQHDAALRARARAYAGLSKPVIVTFNHEPHTDSGSPADFARAWCRVHDVMKSATGLKNVISAPIAGEWTFSPVNRQHDAEDFITAAVLSRCHLLGIDLYQNSSGETYVERLGRVVQWLDARGHSNKQIGLGETACSMDFRNPDGIEWWNTSWTWAVNSGRVAALSYYNSSRNNTLGHDWVLHETSAKLQAFRTSLGSAAATRL